jgi:hypothetical protein
VRGVISFRFNGGWGEAGAEATRSTKPWTSPRREMVRLELYVWKYQIRFSEEH